MTKLPLMRHLSVCLALILAMVAIPVFAMGLQHRVDNGVMYPHTTGMWANVYVPADWAAITEKDAHQNYSIAILYYDESWSRKGMIELGIIKGDGGIWPAEPKVLLILETTGGQQNFFYPATISPGWHTIAVWRWSANHYALYVDGAYWYTDLVVTLGEPSVDRLYGMSWSEVFTGGETSIPNLYHAVYWRSSETEWDWAQIFLGY